MSKQLNCPYCPATSSHGAGLASHIRSAHADKHDAWSKARKSGEKIAPKIAITPASSAGMSGGLTSIIAELEQKRSAIEAALVALRGVGGVISGEPVKRKRGRPRKIA